MLAVESALKNALRIELAKPVSDLAASLRLIADRLASGDWESLLERLERAAEEQAAAAEQSPAEPESPPRACAVIGCRNPPRSLGYCAAHYQKRRLMIAANRLHPLWVEEAAPHSVPDVIPPRRPRGERQREETPAAQARPSIEPRMWVRKKGATPAAAPEKGADVTDAASQQSVQEQVASTVGRWVQEFQARKHRT